MEKQEKYLRSIAESMYGIHKELVKLNQTHPANKAEGKSQDTDRDITELDPKDFI